MRKIRHALSGAVYEVDTDGTIRVETKDGRVGNFSRLGEYLSGDVRSVDPQLCGWIGGVQLASRHADAAKAAAAARKDS
jgi:hypothetical protein